MMEKTTIMIIEDDRDVRSSICYLFEKEGYRVIEAKSGKEGLSFFSGKVKLIILDIMMPGMSGIEVCERIRETSYVPILFLTAKSTDTDKINGFRAGGDDYLVKPFSFPELSARAAALIRRHSQYNQFFAGQEREKECPDEWLEHSGVRISRKRNQVYIGKKEVELTEKEYQILFLLMRYPYKIFSVENIYESVWNAPYFPTSSNTVMVHIRQLRKKIEPNPEKPSRIRTVWGKGYRFEKA